MQDPIVADLGIFREKLEKMRFGRKICFMQGQVWEKKMVVFFHYAPTSLDFLVLGRK